MWAPLRKRFFLDDTQKRNVELRAIQRFEKRKETRMVLIWKMTFQLLVAATARAHQEDPLMIQLRGSSRPRGSSAPRGSSIYLLYMIVLDYELLCTTATWVIASRELELFLYKREDRKKGRNVGQTEAAYRESPAPDGDVVDVVNLEVVGQVEDHVLAGSRL